MKMKTFILAFVAIATLGITSCSNDDNSGNNLPVNAYKYGNDQLAINFAATASLDNRIGFYVTPGTDSSNNNDQYLFFFIPSTELGKKISLNENPKNIVNVSRDIPQTENNPYAYIVNGTFANNVNEIYEFIQTADVPREDKITGTNNWVKATKNGSEEHNYTIEFEMTIDGKVLIGSYTGVFAPVEG